MCGMEKVTRNAGTRAGWSGADGELRVVCRADVKGYGTLCGCADMDCLCRALRPSCLYLYAREEQQVSDCACKDMERRIGRRRRAQPSDQGDWGTGAVDDMLSAWSYSLGFLGSTAEAISGDTGVKFTV